jgi:hypothetical protein
MRWMDSTEENEKKGALGIVYETYRIRTSDRQL